MAEAEDRILQYEKLVLAASQVKDVRKVQELEGGIRNLLNAANNDLNSAIKAANTQVLMLGEENFRLNPNPKTGPIATIYPFINRIIEICKEIETLKANKKYRELVDTVSVLERNMYLLKETMLKGNYKQKDQLVLQYRNVLNRSKSDLKKVNFELAA